MNHINVSQDGVLIYWDSAKAPRADVRTAFKAIGADSLLPLFDPIECLKAVAKDIVDQSGIKVRGQPIDYRQLRRDVIGISAVREIKGNKRNQYKPLFSLGCEGDSLDNFVVKFFDVDTVECPTIAQHLSSLEQAARDLWMGHKDWLPASDLTEAMRRLVFRLRGTMTKKSGGLYFMFKDALPDFEKVVTRIEQSDTDADFTIASTPIEFNDRMFKSVMKGLEEEILYHTQKMQDEVSTLADGGARMRRNGIERRLKDICEWTDKVEYYEQTMGSSLPKLRQAIEDAKYAIGVHGLASMGSSN
jgi:hypothetical protein